MFEEGQLSGVAWVAEFPAEPERGQPELRRVFGHAALGSDVIQKFAPGKSQYIGQLELLAAITPYTSLGEELRGRRVIHWIDNKSAIAALVKGYSAAPDAA